MPSVLQVVYRGVTCLDGASLVISPRHRMYIAADEVARLLVNRRMRYYGGEGERDKRRGEKDSRAERREMHCRRQWQI